MSLDLEISPVAYPQVEADWLPGLRPYPYQWHVYQLIQKAFANNETLCIFLITPTGSGKTLASYAYNIKTGTPALGVYPTNELIRDQERALQPWIDPDGNNRLLRIDSSQLDDWQAKLDLGRHSETLETLLNWKPTLLTNPDILFYTFFGLYKGPAGVSQRLFTLVSSVYRLFLFDEFHLYNVKQMADVAFLIGALQAINPDRGRVFLFASATPNLPMWLWERLGLQVEVVEGKPSNAQEARTIAHPLRLTLVPADLARWKGPEALVDHLREVDAFLEGYPQARLVTILDAVTGAINVAQTFRDRYSNRSIGEVHGFSSAQEREEALQRPITIGTSTIEVGIDFQGDREKDVLIFEARTASQFVQRFGRIARHEKSSSVPNWALALVPEYVYHFLTKRASTGRSLSRQELYDLIDEAYQLPEDFRRYIATHAPVEFHAAKWFIGRLFQPDDRSRINVELEALIETLTGKNGRQAWGLHRQYEEEGIIAPLMTFRGAGFEAAILDERGTDPGFPAKRYDLMFLLRRGVFEEIDPNAYKERLEGWAETWPEDVAREQRYSKVVERGADKLLGVYGFFRLTGLLDKGRKVWFEVDEEEVHGCKGQVTIISGLQLVTDPPVRLRRLERLLDRKEIVAWFIDQHPAAIKLGRSLPHLFAVYELRIRKAGGALSDAVWSIAFNQDAYFLDSLYWDLKDNDEIFII